MDKRHLLEVQPDELAAWLADAGEAGYRAAQIGEWVWRQFAASFDEMTNVPAGLRKRLAEAFRVELPRTVDERVSEDGATGKLLLDLGDERIECVWMDDRGRATFCISSQAGCPLDCRFCATGSAGFRRNLAVAEILGQAAALARRMGQIRNVVFMGMGEPLLNVEAVVASVEALADKRRCGLSPRHITVSTAGIPPGIERLARAVAHPNLALSLNSPFDEQRSELMPVNRRFPLAEVLEACEKYAETTGRRIMLEYVLLGDVNTGADAALALAKIARRLGAAVNLIPFNTVDGSGCRPPSTAEAAEFRRMLEGQGVEVTQRFRRGRDIAAACGQLRGETEGGGRGRD